MVKAQDKPTPEEMEKYKAFYNGDVNGGAEEYYNLLRDIQGEPKSYLDYPELDIMIDSEDFLQDSLFCEWAYIINLDENQLEIYRGFQTEPKSSRYYDETDSSNKEYYPVGELAVVEFNAITNFSMEKLEESLE